MVSVFMIKRIETAILLLDLIKECEPVSINTTFQKKKGKLWTHTYPDRERAQLDHIFINMKWKTVQWTASLTTQCALYSLIIGHALHNLFVAKNLPNAEVIS